MGVSSVSNKYFWILESSPGVPETTYPQYKGIKDFGQYYPIFSQGKTAAYDPVRDVIVHVASNGSPYGTSSVQTWEYAVSKNVWAGPMASPPLSVPPANRLGGTPMCWDGVNNRILLWLAPTYGSYVPGGGSLWSWDGATWARIDSSIYNWSPYLGYGRTQQDYMGMVWDEANQVIWMTTSKFKISPVVYIYDPADSRGPEGAILPASTYGSPTAPLSRSNFGVAFDPINNGLLISHGNHYGGPLDDTWLATWDGALSITWTDVTPSTRPSARSNANMATGPNGVFLFTGWYKGGYPYTLFKELWFWDGTSWTEVNDSPFNALDLQGDMIAVGRYPIL